VESVEGFLPERAVLRDPIGRRGEGAGIEPAVVDPSLLALLDEPGVFQNFQVLRNGGQRHVERFREIGDSRLAEGEPREDGAPGRIRERGKGAVQSP
jgi:hypothetical protein